MFNIWDKYEKNKNKWEGMDPLTSIGILGSG